MLSMFKEQEYQFGCNLIRVDAMHFVGALLSLQVFASGFKILTLKWKQGSSAKLIFAHLNT